MNTSFKWEELLNKCQILDLFAERTLLELRLQGDTVNKQGTEALEQILLNQDATFCIIIRAPKLKTQTLNSPWVNHIRKKGKIQATKPAVNPLYELTDSAKTGDLTRTINIFNNLKADGIEPILVLWALTRESRNLPTAKAAKLLKMAKNIDFTIKGIQPGDAWDLLLDMCVILTSNNGGAV